MGFLFVLHVLMECLKYIQQQLQHLIIYRALPRTRKAPSRHALRQRSQTIVRRRLVRRQLNRHIAADSEYVVEVEVAPRGRRDAVDRDVRDVGSDAGRDGLLDRFRVEADRGDGGRDVQVRVVDGVLRSEGRQDEVLRRRGHWIET